jgi:large subunit ribosomal protein L15
MNLTTLSNVAGKVSRDRKRLGRGPGSGTGKTSGKGHKGAMARTGYKYKVYFEGGQMPMVRRLPKRGFNNEAFRKEYAVLNLADLERAFDDGAKVGPEEFLGAGLVNRELSGIKVLAKGEIKKKLSVSAHKFSAAAAEKIKAAGGTVTVIGA